MSDAILAGSIFWSGGGDATQSKLLDKQFIDSLKQRSVLYIPIASRRDVQGFEACYDWIIGTLDKVSEEFIDIELCLDLGTIQIDDLKRYGGVYMGGGNTYHLLNQIKNSGFDRVLTKYLQQGGMVYGGSAGAIVLGKSIETVKEEDDSSFIFNEGLDLAEGYSIRCHYTATDDQRIEAFVLENNLPAIALPEDCGLVKNSRIGKMTVLGFSPATIFISNGSRHLVMPGEVVLNASE